MFRIITIEREYGCGAAQIAQELSHRLGWKLWDNALTEEIATLAKVEPSAVLRCDERMDSTLHRLSKVFWRGSYERSMAVPAADSFDADRMVAMVEEVVEKAAEQGNCVIVGRGAPYFLRDRAEVFSVFLFAPRAEKLRRLLASGKSQAEAEDLVNTVDADRVAFIRHYFKADWPTRALYHIMLNTAVGNESVITTILNTMNLLEGHPAERSL